jgi:hypothetical protein
MRIKRFQSIRGFFTITLVAALFSCATYKAPLKIQNGLSQDQLAYYSDSFEKMREDLWDRAGYLYSDEQAQNFKQADLRFTDGQLIIRTKTGSFSLGGLSSRFLIRGDFDVQLDCLMNFKFGSLDMDQVFSFVVLDKTLKPGKMSFVSMGLAIAGGGDRGILFSNSVLDGRRKKGLMQPIDNFKGSLRIIRKGQNISTLYKNEGAGRWNRMGIFRLTDNDMLIGFQLRNFFVKRTLIVANHSISAAVNRFKINAARAIIEEEI